MSTDQTPPPQSQKSGCATWFILGIACVAVAVVFISIGADLLFDIERPSGQDTRVVGKPYPDLELTPITLNENPVSLPELSGKVALVNFWATWCEPCRIELPEIVGLGDKFARDEDFVLLPVSCGSNDPDELSSETVLLMRDMNLQMPCYSDPTGETRQALASLTGMSQMSLPTTLVIDREGIVRGFWKGYRPGQGADMEKLIEKLLAEKAK